MSIATTAARQVPWLKVSKALHMLSHGLPVYMYACGVISVFPTHWKSPQLRGVSCQRHACKFAHRGAHMCVCVCMCVLCFCMQSCLAYISCEWVSLLALHSKACCSFDNVSQRERVSESGRVCMCMGVCMHFIKGNFRKSTDAATQHSAFYYYYTAFHWINVYTKSRCRCRCQRQHDCKASRICEKRKKKIANKKTIYIYTHIQAQR